MDAVHWEHLDRGDEVIYVPEQKRFQVNRILPNGDKFLLRIVDDTKKSGVNFTVSETVTLRDNHEDWQYSPRNRKRMVAEGGFTVERADGTKEYDRCPPTVIRKES